MLITSWTYELDKLDVLLNKIHIAKDTPNMSDLELKALFNLKDRDDVVFKKADKGNAIVIMDRDDYIREAHNQIFNDKYYKPLEGPVYLNTTDEVNSILDKSLLNGWLDNTQVEYLRPADNPRPCIFYTLPKIHKPMDKWLVPDKIPPGRPIVSDCSSDSYHISELIDHFIKPRSNRHPSYVKDTWDLLDKLRDIEVPSNAILVTADVQSPHTNMQPNKGLEALGKMYDEYDVSMPFEEINRLLELSLLHNDFLFNDRWFLQTSGTAMGKKYAPSFANIFMANLGDEVLRKAKCKPLAMFRFIDDIFFIWNHSRDELINLFNSHDDSIKIDCNINETSVDFLDVTIFKGSGFSNHNILDTKVFFTETDTHELLHKKSFHPKHTFEGILKSQLIRFLTICNNMEDFHEATSILFKVLREKRHYSGRFLRQVKARFLRNYRQPGNTLDPIGAALKCKSSRCQCCLYLDEKSHFNNDDFDFPIFGGLNCLSKNIIYIIECKACGDKYVGETGRCLKDRMFNHISDIRRNKNGPVSRHFNNADNICFGAEYNMILYHIEQITDQGNEQKNKSLRLKRELHWIKTFGTQFPHGMNHKIVRKRDIFITFPFSNNARKAFKITKDIYTKLQNMYPNVFKDELICSFKRNKNLGDYLVSAKLK